MSTDLLTAGAAAYDENRGAFNLLLDQRPEAIALPTSAAEVATTIAAAKAQGMRVTAQRTGHGADPLGDLEETLLIRTAGLGGMEIDAGARRARVGAGAVWGDLMPAASEGGLTALHGSSPLVGIVGYTLGGGVGWYARKHGLACNAVTAVELVDGNGEQHRVDADNEPELFWAVRGGGGDFGIVTALEFELLPISAVHAGVLFFPVERAAEVLGAYREWAATASEEVTSVGRLIAFPPFPEIPEPLRGKSFAIVEAVFLSGEEAAAESLAPLRELGPAMDTFATMPPAGIADLHMDPPEPGPALGDGMLLRDLEDGALDALLEVVGPGTDSPLVSVELRHIGGALGRDGGGCGALGSLAGEFLLFAIGVVPDPALRAPVLDRVARTEAAMQPWGAGRYRNFSISPIDAAESFSAETVARLCAAKAKYDPDNLFRSNHPVVTG